MPYRSPVEDFQFLLQHVVGYNEVADTELFAEANNEMVQAILGEAGKLCDNVLAPLQRHGDTMPAVLENGVVRTSPGFAGGYQAIAEGGWIGAAAQPENGGMGLPSSVTTSINDMMSGACLSMELAPLMSIGQIEALEHHASDAIKQLYVPKLISGEWTGTMNLTEPAAGSDVGALSSKAVRNDDGTYSITGQKVFISWGDNDFAENVCHLVLARLPDGKPGTKGISLFIVPKFLPNDEGSVGQRNNLSVVSLEEKMGLHGSPTCVMAYEGAKGWLIGNEHDGIKCMFTMMNNARLGVGVQGVGVAEAAYQHALAFAMERKQGRTPEEGVETIIGHADVRRMVTTMKADITVARGIALFCAVALDMARATGDAAWTARAGLLTPIAKAFGTDTGASVSDMGVQVHGGMGYVEESGAAQFFRDVRVTQIYEGTNGIQAMDLVGRKMMDGGEAAFGMLDEIEAEAEAARAQFPDLAEAVWDAAESMREATEWMVAQKDMTVRFAGATAYLKAFARVLGGHIHLRSALADVNGSRARLARFYINRMLPEAATLLIQARAGSQDLYALSPQDLVN